MALLGLMGASILGSLIQGRSASKAADAQADAARQANETERYIFDRSVDLTEPQRVMGQNALSALGYEAGIAPLPTFGSAQAGNGANALSGGLSIEEIPGQNGGGLTFTGGNVGDGQTAYLNGRVVATGVNNQAEIDRLTAMYGGQGAGGFKVGDQTFSTREEAQAYIDGQPMADAPQGGIEYQPIAFPDAPDTSLEAFEASPGYQFRVDEGMKAIERAASARGLRLSGGALKDAARFNQGIGADEYGAFYGRKQGEFGRDYGVAMDKRNLLSGLAGIGQQATQSQIGAGNQYAAGTSANLANKGNALAGGYLGQAGAVTSGINNLSNIYGMGMSGYLGQTPGLGIKPLANPFGG